MRLTDSQAFVLTLSIAIALAVLVDLVAATMFAVGGSYALMLEDWVTDDE